MEPTELGIKRLRLMVNDPVPVDGTGVPLFADEELELMFFEHESIFSLASEIWTIKAGLIQGDIESYSAGDEKYDLTSIKDRYTHALTMAKLYEGKADDEAESEVVGGSYMLQVKAPEVM